MGNSVGVVWPDFKRKHPVFRFVAPYMMYVVPDTEEPYMLSKAIIAERFPRLAVQEAYPRAKIADSALNFAMSGDTSSANNASFIASSGSVGTNPADGSIEVVKCFNKNEVVTLIGGVEVGRAVQERGLVIRSHRGGGQSCYRLLPLEGADET